MNRQVNGYSVIEKINSRAEDGAGLILISKANQNMRMARVYPVEEMKSEEIQNVLDSLRILASMNHPNFLRLFDAFVEEEEGNLYIVTEYCLITPLGDASKTNLLTKGNMNEPAFSLQGRCLILAELLNAFKELNRRGLVYRNLTLNDVLVTEKGNIKLSGLHKLQMADKEVPKDFIWDPRFTAPETLLDKKVRPASYIYSAGIILHFITYNKLPYDGSAFKEIKNKAINGELDEVSFQDEDMDDLIMELISLHPDERPQMDEIMNSKQIKPYSDLVKLETKNEFNSELSSSELLAKIKYDPKERNLRKFNSALKSIMDQRFKMVLGGKMPKEKPLINDKLKTEKSNKQIEYTISNLESTIGEEEDDENEEEEENLEEHEEEEEDAAEDEEESDLSSNAKMVADSDPAKVPKGQVNDEIQQVTLHKINSIENKKTAQAKTIKSEIQYGSIRQFADSRELSFLPLVKINKYKNVPPPDLVMKKPILLSHVNLPSLKKTKNL